MGHSKTPWKVHSMEQFHSAGEFGIEIVSADGNVIADNQTYYPAAISEPDARRIVAAVNACAGLSTDLLEKAALTAAHIEERERLSFCTQKIEEERDQLQQQNAQLLAALRDVISWVPGREKWHTDEPIKAVERARAVMGATVKESLTVDHQASGGASVEQQLATERASLFAESQRKQQLEQQVEELVWVLESVTLTQDDIEMGRSASDEQHAAARAVIQKVRGGE